MLPLAARAPWSLLWALLLVRFADEWVTFFPAGALEPIREELGLTYGEIGLVLGSLSAGGLIGSGLKVAADFVDRRALATAGALGYAVCLLAFALGGSLPVLLVAGFVWGAAGDAFVEGCEVALIDLYREDVAPAIGRIYAYAAVGDLLGPLTLAALAALGWSWRAAFGLGAGAMLLYAIWLLAQRFPPTTRPPDTGSARQAVMAVARDRRVVLLAIVDGLYGLLDEPFLGFTVAFLERVRGETPAVATATISVSVVGGIVGFLAVPLFTARWPAGALLRSLPAAMVVEIATLVVAPLPLQVAAIGAFGLSGALFYAILTARVLSLRPGLVGTTKAVVATVGQAGLAFPWLVGATADALGLAAGLALYAAVPVAILVLLALGGARASDGAS